MDGKTVDEEAIRGINVYFTAYMLLVILSTFLVCIDGTDLVSGFSSVLGTFNNIGNGSCKIQRPAISVLRQLSVNVCTFLICWQDVWKYSRY